MSYEDGSSCRSVALREQTGAPGEEGLPGATLTALLVVLRALGHRAEAIFGYSWQEVDLCTRSSAVH